MTVKDVLPQLNFKLEELIQRAVVNDEVDGQLGLKGNCFHVLFNRFPREDFFSK